MGGRGLKCYGGTDVSVSKGLKMNRKSADATEDRHLFWGTEAFI